MECSKSVSYSTTPNIPKKILGQDMIDGRIYECVETDNPGPCGICRGNLVVKLFRLSTVRNYDSIEKDMSLLNLATLQVFNGSSSNIWYVERPDIILVNLHFPLQNPLDF